VVDFEKMLEILYSESVTCMFDIVVGLGDVSAFTLSVVTLVAVDNQLIQVPSRPPSPPCPTTTALQSSLSESEPSLTAPRCVPHSPKTVRH